MGKNVLKIAGAALGAYFAPAGLLASSIGAVGGAATASALGEKPTINLPAPPTPEPVKTLPTPDADAVRETKKKSIAQMRARKGRASTILTADTAVSDALGG